MHPEATTLSSIGLANRGSEAVQLTKVEAKAEGLQLETFFVTSESNMATVPPQGGAWPKNAPNDREIGPAERVWVSVKLRNSTSSPITHSGFDITYTTDGRTGHLHAGSRFTVMGAGSTTCKGRPASPTGS